MKITPSKFVLSGIALIALLCLTYLVWPSARFPVSCAVITQTNDASGLVHVEFELTNGYSSSVFVGLYSVDTKTASGWRSVRKIEAGEPVAGVPAHAAKRFWFSPPQDLAVWRLRLIYSPPSRSLETAISFGLAKLVGNWRDPNEIVTTPEILYEPMPNKSD